MDVWWTLHLKRDLASVPLARRILLGTMESAGVDPQISYDLGVALTEACANAVEHAAGGRVDDGFQVTASIEGDRLRIEVTDSGPGLPAAPRLHPARPQAPAPAPAHAHVVGGGEPALEKPVFIIAAPRSGSTLLFETLACTPGFNSFGEEAHWLIEGHAELRPGAPGVSSNRLTSNDATATLIAAIRRSALERLRGPDGAPPAEDAPLLEKTPKNALRIPFLKQVFPDARFIFLWRDPRENVSSIMEAWRAGRWITYRALPGWEGPWSLLLPPGWQFLRGAALEAVAAWQWRRTNQIALDDLQQLSPQDWTHINYQDVLEDPEAAVRRLCDFAGVPFDAALQSRTAGQLPSSRHTHTAPAPGKWRRNEEEILRVMSDLEPVWQRLRTLT